MNLKKLSGHELYNLCEELEEERKAIETQDRKAMEEWRKEQKELAQKKVNKRG